MALSSLSVSRRFRIICCGGFLLLCTLMILSLFLGKFSIGVDEGLSVLLGREDVVPMHRHILLELRMPRIVMAALVGGALALAGTAFQSVLHNPLASPDVLGTSSASGFGAALGILLWPGNMVAVALCSFVFGMFSLMMVFGLCRAKGDGSLLTLVLSGIVVSSLFLSFISIAKLVADREDLLPAVTFWLMGSFAGATVNQIQTLVVPCILGAAVLMALRWKLNVLSLGDEEALALGVNPRRLRCVVLTAAALLVSSSVTVSGMVGWVGLVIPHAARRMIGANHGHVVLLSALTGAVFTVIVDTIARNAGFAEIPVSIVTALVGAPAFVLLVMLRREDS